MAEVLQLAQLVQHHRVAEMDVGRGRIEAELAAQRLAARVRARELLRESDSTSSSSLPRLTSASACSISRVIG